MVRIVVTLRRRDECGVESYTKSTRCQSLEKMHQRYRDTVFQTVQDQASVLLNLPARFNRCKHGLHTRAAPFNNLLSGIRSSPLPWNVERCFLCAWYEGWCTHATSRPEPCRYAGARTKRAARE